MAQRSHTITAFLKGGMCLLLALGLAACRTVKRFYVSPHGNDAWSGTRPDPARTGRDGPFATLSRARQAVRGERLRRPAPETIEVLIRGGTYRLRSALVFSPADSGTAQCPVVYRAFGDEEPVFSGALVLEGWEKVPHAGSNLWRTRAPMVDGRRAAFRQLFADGRRLQRARHPNNGYLRMAGPSTCCSDPARMFRFRRGDLLAEDAASTAGIVVYHASHASRHWIEHIDPDARIVTLTNKGAPRPFGAAEARQRYVLENVPRALDVPGEWLLSEQGEVLYIAGEGENPNTMVFEAPVVQETLLAIRGHPDDHLFVQHIAFRDLTFRHTSWPVRKSQWYDWQDFSALRSGVVYAEGARECRFERCTVSQAGVHGICLGEGCRGNTVRQCHCHDLGGGGVYVGDRRRRRGDRAVTGNCVENSLIHDLGKVFPGSVGIYLGCVSECRVSHNHVCDNDWSGISLGYGRLARADNVVEFNRVHRVGRYVFGEVAGVFAAGVSPGAHVHGNAIHDITAAPRGRGAFGILADQGAAGYTFARNLVHSVDHAGICCWGASADVTVTGNILVNCGSGGLHSGGGHRRGVSVRGNAVLNGTCYDAVTGTWVPAEFADNRYWKTGLGRDTLRFSGRSLAHWQANGNDADSAIEDPGLPSLSPRTEADTIVAALRKMGPGSDGKPAAGLEPPGLRGDRTWRMLGNSLLGSPPPLPPNQPSGFSDDFEASAPGNHPACFDTIREHEGRDGASKIRVASVENGADGNCLCILDVPGQPASFLPFASRAGPYRAAQGGFRLEFDFMNARAAPGLVRVSLRDHWSPHYVSFPEPVLEPFFRGPTVSFHPDGRVTAGDADIGLLETGQWAHVTIVFERGHATPPVFAVSILPAHQGNAIGYEDIPVPDPRFAVASDLCLVGDANPRQGTLKSYLDNLRMETGRPPDLARHTP